MNNPIITAERLARRPVLRQAPLARVANDGGLLKIAPVIILVLALMMPPEVRINLAGQTIYAYRMAWLLLTPWVMMRLLRGEIDWRFNDLLVFLGSTWVTFSFILIYGAETGIPSGAGVTLDLLIPYIIARLSISNLQDLRRALVALCPAFLVVAFLMPLEAVLHERFVRDTATAVFGRLGGSEFGMDSAFAVATDTRFGFLRAMGPFSHPILAGVFFASLLPLYHWSGLRSWPRICGMVAGSSAIFTFSSAAILAIFLFLIFAIYDFIKKNVSFLNWQIFIGALSAAGVVAHVLSEKGLISVLIRLTFSPATGYYRLAIWENGVASVERNPWFGIGYDRFEAYAWMGDSIDAHFLNIAVRHGLPAAMLIFVSVLIAIFGCAMAASRSKEPDYSLFVGLAVTMAMLAIVAFSVTYFGGMLIWFMILVGTASTTQPSKRSKMVLLAPASQKAGP